MAPVLREGYRLVRRDWRTRELRILAIALIVAVATVTAITLFSERLQQTIFRSSSQFLAADRQITSPRPVPEDWIVEAQRRGLRTAQVLEFASMLFVGEQMQLVSVKAVSDHYPLVGQVDVSDAPGQPSHPVAEAPAPGTIWVAPRLLPLLGVTIGQDAAVGDASLKVERVVQREPDASFGFMSLSPRVLMNWADVPATGVVQPGSRLSYRYLFAGSAAALASYETWLKPQLGASHRWLDVKSGRPAIADAIDKAERYLLLAGSLAVILAAVAIAMSAHQYAQRQFDTVALLKTLGLRSSRINRLYFSSFVVLGVLASLLGLALGWVGHRLILSALADVLPQVETQVSWRAPLVAVLTALVCLLAFAMPPLWMLRKVAPIRVLRRDWQLDSASTLGVYGLALVAIVLLLYLYSRDALLTLLVSGGLLLVMLVFMVIAALLLRTGRALGTRAGSFWRLGMASIARRRWQSVLQIVVFATAMMLLAVIFLLRTSLISQWQAQLPADAPNHFFINIAPDQEPQVAQYLDSHQIRSAGLYPMVRGRLTEINGSPAKESVSKDENVNALNRELNLTWMTQLPSDNRIEAGEWWPANTRNQPWVSVESKLAERLHLKLGDRLGFLIGDRPIEVEVRNLRSVQWDSMQPNFYMVFTPGTLDAFPATYITSAYLSPEQKSLLNGLSSQFPTITVLELDQLVDKVRSVMTQVGLAVELVLLMILAASLLVIAALVNVTMGERFRESALLRALGAGRRLVAGGLFVEFALLGALAGIVAIVGAELTVWGIQDRILKIGNHLHPEIWLGLPLLGALLVGLLGYLQSAKVVRVAPMETLRQAE